MPAPKPPRSLCDRDVLEHNERGCRYHQSTITIGTVVTCVLVQLPCRIESETTYWVDRQPLAGPFPIRPYTRDLKQSIDRGPHRRQVLKTILAALRARVKQEGRLPRHQLWCR